MKNFQINLFIILAIGLCSLCAWQWYVQTVQRTEIQTLNQLVYVRNAAIQGYTNSIATLNHQVNDMDARMTSIKAEAATNQQMVAVQKAQIAQLQLLNDNFTNEIAQYKAGVDALEARLKEAYAGIDKQNESITNLVAQRNDLVTKYNNEVKDRNYIVEKYNELARQIQSTNQPPNQ